MKASDLTLIALLALESEPLLGRGAAPRGGGDPLSREETRGASQQILGGRIPDVCGPREKVWGFPAWRRG